MNVISPCPQHCTCCFHMAILASNRRWVDSVGGRLWITIVSPRRIVQNTATVWLHLMNELTTSNTTCYESNGEHYKGLHTTILFTNNIVSCTHPTLSQRVLSAFLVVPSQQSQFENKPICDVVLFHWLVSDACMIRSALPYFDMGMTTLHVRILDNACIV